MKNAADYYDMGVGLSVTDSAGRIRTYVTLDVYERVVAELQKRLRDLISERERAT